MHRTFSETVGDRIRRAMRERGYSGNALAARAGINPGNLSVSLRNSGDPRIRRVEVIAAALGVDFTWLTTGAGKLEVRTKFQWLPDDFEPQPALAAAKAVAARKLCPEERVLTALKDTVNNAEGKRLSGVEWLGALEDTLDRGTRNQSGVVLKPSKLKIGRFASASPNKFAGALIAEERGVPGETIMVVLKDKTLPDTAMDPYQWAEHMTSRAGDARSA